MDRKEIHEQAAREEQAGAIAFAIRKAAESLSAEDPGYVLGSADYMLTHDRLDHYHREAIDQVFAAAKLALNTRAQSAARVAPAT